MNRILKFLSVSFLTLLAALPVYSDEALLSALVDASITVPADIATQISNAEGEEATIAAIEALIISLGDDGETILEVVSVAVSQSPTFAVAIVEAASNLVPSLTASIVSTAISAAPPGAAAGITAAAVTLMPTQVEAILAAAKAAAPNQSDAIDAAVAALSQSNDPQDGDNAPPSPS